MDMDIAGSVCFLAMIFGLITSIVFWKKCTKERWHTGAVLVMIVTIIGFAGTLNPLLHLLQLLRY